jgi:hypothetical protein
MKISLTGTSYQYLIKSEGTESFIFDNKHRSDYVRILHQHIHMVKSHYRGNFKKTTLANFMQNDIVKTMQLVPYDARCSDTELPKRAWSHNGTKTRKFT